MNSKFFPAALGIMLLAAAALQGAENLVADPSFEMPKEKDRWGPVFDKWGGWKYEGECEFRVSADRPHRQALAADRRRQQPEDPRVRRQAGPRAGPLPDHRLSPRAGHRHGRLEPDHRVHVRRQVHAAGQERHVRLDEADLRGRGARRRRRSRPSFGLMAPGLPVDRRRVGRARWATTCR